MFKTPKEFIDFMTPPAKAIEAKTGIPYKFIIAQTALETGYGKSSLVSEAFNFGGIKAFGNEPFVLAWTWEHVDDKNKFPSRDVSKDKLLPNGKTAIRIQAKFAKYPDLVTGLTKYAKILQNKYFNKYIAQAKGSPTKYAELLQSGTPKYATDINYVAKIHKLINTIV
jgi:flagellar protein FlgJ